MPRLTIEQDVGDEEPLVLPARYEVCGRCAGHGVVDHPAFSNGLRQDELEDADFMEEYWAGSYDRVCPECGGQRVVTVPDEDRCDPATLKRYYDWHRCMAEIDACHAAERRMGA